MATMSNEKYDEIIRAMREAHGPFYMSKQEMESLLRIEAEDFEGDR